MKDIDFDELDKAVNSLMASTSPKADDDTTPPQPAENVDASATNPAPTSAPVPQPVTTPVSPTEPAPAPSVPDATPITVRPVPPAARRAGRFMDMVSTPSDAKQRNVATPAPSREGLSITPRSTESAATPAPVVTPEPEAAASEQTFESMPDPIDLQQQSLASPEPTVAETVQLESDETSNPPLGSVESPFLTDAKVEKRPLNAGTFDQALGDALLETPEDDSLDTIADDAQSQEDHKGGDEPPAVPQIAELDSELVAIEANEKVEVTQAVETADATGQVTSPSTPLGTTSIPQQYTVQPSSGDQSHAAIYDSSQYPEPVSHPAKSKSGWLWVLWVTLLLGLGAGGAIALYGLGIIP